jgi:hypothetical protein
MKKVIVSIFAVLLCGAFSAPAAERPCLKYEPEVVDLQGTVKRVVFPGPPNYENIKNGDEAEPYWVLYLPKEICVQGDPKDEFNSETEKNVTSLQLMDVDYRQDRSLLGKSVVVQGTLMHSFTGHHHTPVLIQVKSVEKAPGSKVDRKP